MIKIYSTQSHSQTGLKFNAIETLTLSSRQGQELIRPALQLMHLFCLFDFLSCYNNKIYSNKSEDLVYC
jgi:hypothetical protein